MAPTIFSVSLMTTSVAPRRRSLPLIWIAWSLFLQSTSWDSGLPSGSRYEKVIFMFFSNVGASPALLHARRVSAGAGVRFPCEVARAACQQPPRRSQPSGDYGPISRPQARRPRTDHHQSIFRSSLRSSRTNMVIQLSALRQKAALSSTTPVSQKASQKIPAHVRSLSICILLEDCAARSSTVSTAVVPPRKWRHTGGMLCGIEKNVLAPA